MRKSQSQSDGNAAGRQGEARLGAGCSQDEHMECCLGGATQEFPQLNCSSGRTHGMGWDLFPPGSCCLW